MKKLISCCLAAVALSAGAQTYSHTLLNENLNRGLVAFKGTTGNMVSWRSLATDAPDMTFDLYRDGVKLNAAPISKSTCYTDADGTAAAVYEVRCLVGGTVVDTQTVTAWSDTYLKVHLDRPEGGTSPAGGKDEQREYTYTPDDVSVGDVDGDGQYELIVKWFPTNAADNSFRRYTGNTILDCYRLDGTKLWRIDLGCNIRSGNHYTQFMVWDFDGDGRAELMCKTAPGTIDGQGNPVLMGSDKADADYRNSEGIILSGSEYLTVFDGLTGAQRCTVAYNPPRSIRSSSQWGDSYGNRCERYLACVAYLDGEHPSAVFCRGYYTAAYLWAVDFDGTNITERWLHKAETKGQDVYGEGAHAITVGDVDGDGCDEIMYGAAAVDHDGTFMYRTGLGHGDALHLAAMLPEREGLQCYMPHEEKTVKYSAHMRDARTGEILYYLEQTGEDNGRGLAANICAPAGYEYWSSKQRVPRNQDVSVGSKSPSINFRIFWDGDLYDELLDGTALTKIGATNTQSIQTLKEFSQVSNAASCNSTKKTPNLQADILGDWREEVILHDGTTESDLLIFSTPIATDYKITCLMQDRQYREAIAWQNVAYNQPPHLSYSVEETFGAAGSITVYEGQLNQVVYSGDEISPIKFKIRKAEGAQIKMGPDWLQLSYADGIATLTGVAGYPGEYNFRVQTVGSYDGVETQLQGKIVVREKPQLSAMAHFAFDANGTATINTVYGSATAENGTVADTDGRIGGAAHFAGNRYRQEGYPQLDFGAESFSVELWFRSTDAAAYLFHKGSLANDGASHTGHWVGVELKNGSLKFGIDDDVTKSDLTVSGAAGWFDGQWHHLVVVRDVDAKLILMYIDGEKVGEAADNTGAINCAGEDLVIADVNVNLNNAYEGDLDEMTVFKGAMSASTVRERYLNPAGIASAVADIDSAYIAVDARTGIVMARGRSLDIVDSLPRGMYIIAKGGECYKFVK